jgi:predicted DNA-binding antitoxin AbrB/MazE fold protein
VIKMITQTIEAVFEDGVFRPLTPLREVIPKGRPVRLSIESEESPSNILALATQVYEGLSETQIDEIEEIAFSRRNEILATVCLS